MSLAHHPHLSGRARLRASGMARLALALSAAALLSACAGMTERVVDRGEPTVTLRTHGTGRSDAGALQARYVTISNPTAAAESTYYNDRKASGTSRAAPHSATRVKRDGLTRTWTDSTARQSIAHVAPALSGPVSDSVAPPDGEPSPSRPLTTMADVDVSSIAFNVPTSMTLDRRTLIQLALAAAAAPLTDSMTQTATDSSRHIGQYIEARLSGSDFVIEPVTANTQTLGRAKATEWLWLVTPKKAGKQQLQLTVTTLTDSGDAPQRRALPTFEHTIQVNTRWQDEVRARIEAHAAWLWAASGATALLLLWSYARWRRKHRRWFHSGF